MTVAIVSMHTPNYQALADITWKNKVDYADTHDYAHCCKTDSTYGLCIGFEKMYFIRDLMNDNPDIEWIWWVGCDTMITNYTIKVEDRIDPLYHFIVAMDVNDINVDSFFIRNSSEGRAFVDHIITLYPIYHDHKWCEQQAMIDSLEQFKEIVKKVPQRSFNSFNYALYPYQGSIDKFGLSGNWEPGDFLIHWPATPLSQRIQLAHYYNKQIIK